MSGGVSLGIIAGVAILAVTIWLVRWWHSRFKSVITEFMEAGAARNVEAAYACWSSQCATKEEIAELIESSYDDVFAGYERLNISGSEGGGSVSINGVHSTGTSVRGAIIYAAASGPIIHTGGKKLPFKAQLAKENGVWKIISIQIGSTKMVDIVRGPSISLGGPPGPG